MNSITVLRFLGYSFHPSSSAYPRYHLGERQFTPWTARQPDAGLTQQNRQPFTPTGTTNYKSLEGRAPTQTPCKLNTGKAQPSGGLKPRVCLLDSVHPRMEDFLYFHYPLEGTVTL